MISGSVLRKRNVILPILGMIFSVLVVTAPEVLPRIVGKPGYVWAPFNSANYRVGDLYYYAPWIKQVISAEIPLRPPTAEATETNGGFENIRSFPFYIAALPGLIFSDFRNVVLADIALSALLFFTAGYFTARSLRLSCEAAFCTAILAYFYSPLWQAIAGNAQSLAPSGPPGLFPWLTTSVGAISSRWPSIWDPLEYDYIGDAFRFVHVSISGPLLCFQLLTGLTLFLRFTVPRSVALFALSLALAFSYPSHSFIGYLTMIGLASAALIRRSWAEFFALAGVGIAVIVVLLAIGYPAMMQHSIDSSAMLQTVFLSSGIKLGPISIATIFHALILNKYLLTTAALVVIFWTDRDLRFAVTAIGLTFTAVSLVTLLEPSSLWHRFVGRGVDLPWGIFVAAGILRALMLLNRRVSCALPLTRYAAWPAILVLCLIPAIGFGKFAEHNAHNLTRFIPWNHWEAYEWIRKNVPAHAPLATLDWDDLAILPSVTSVSLTTGHTDLSGRTPNEQVRRFVAVWKALGRSREELERYLVNSIPALQRRWLSDIRNPPLSNANDFGPSEFAGGLIYWPFIQAIDGVPVVDTSGTATNPALVSHILDLFDGAAGQENPYEYAYVLLSRDANTVQTAPQGGELIFQNAARSLYRMP